MQYEIRKTDHFEKWFRKLKDRAARVRIARRLDSIHAGFFGDHKQLSDRLFELRFFFGPGYRVYYTISGKTVVFILAGGDKAGQETDIKKANEMLQSIEE
jgi:putative addiction module killer protein